MFGSLNSLFELCLNNNKIETIEKDAFCKLTELSKINLYNNHLGNSDEKIKIELNGRSVLIIN
jgi:Leucine-rich repeat (LRR) protein